MRRKKKVTQLEKQILTLKIPTCKIMENYGLENSNIADIYLEVYSIILALGKSPKDKSNRLNFVEDAVRGKQEQSEPNLGS